MQRVLDGVALEVAAVSTPQTPSCSTTSPQRSCRQVFAWRKAFLEEPHAEACSVTEDVLIAMARGDKMTRINQRTDASAAIMATDEVKDYNYGRFYVLDGCCNDLSLNLPETTLCISQPQHAGAICTPSFAVDASLALRRSIVCRADSSAHLINSRGCYLCLVCVLETFATCFDVTTRPPMGY